MKQVSIKFNYSFIQYHSNTCISNEGDTNSSNILSELVIQIVRVVDGIRGLVVAIARAAGLSGGHISLHPGCLGGRKAIRSTCLRDRLGCAAGSLEFSQVGTDGL